jgi:hypothetical protein
MAQEKKKGVGKAVKFIHFFVGGGRVWFGCTALLIQYILRATSMLSFVETLFFVWRGVG